jgi:hypothetical protein
MKVRLLTGAAALALAASPALAQNPRGEARATVAGKAVSIDYGRPSLKGRDMLAQAAVGQPWRMGADAATSLKTEADLAFGAVTVPKGQYTLSATKVAEDRWQLTVSDAAKGKVAEVPLVMAPLTESVEMFTIALTAKENKGEFSMSWGKSSFKAAFTAR